MLDQRYDELVTDALNHWIDFHPTFTKGDLMNRFPWIHEALAEEEIAFWMEQGDIRVQEDHYERTDRKSRNKILFLDVDGVLNHAHADRRIDTVCLSNLAYVIAKTQAIIILISSWKTGWNKTDKEHQYEDAAYLDARLKEVGLSIFDKASIHTGHRVVSVIDYVMKLNADTWVILDDDAFLYKDTLLRPSCVATNYASGGLTRDLAEQAIAILNEIDEGY